jgi:CheY-like chemotaxis protein
MAHRILLVEDNAADAELITQAFAATKSSPAITRVEDGEKALAYLRRENSFSRAERPDLLLLDLNIPRKHGHEVLAEIKADDELRRIPVVVLSGSISPDDVRRSYDLHANCYMQKPVDIRNLFAAAQTLDDLWFRYAKLPKE